MVDIVEEEVDLAENRVVLQGRQTVLWFTVTLDENQLCKNETNCIY
jgi:hypothetical protein